MLLLLLKWTSLIRIILGHHDRMMILTGDFYALSKVHYERLTRYVQYMRSIILSLIQLSGGYRIMEFRH